MGKKIKNRTKEEKIEIHRKHIQSLLEKIEYHKAMIDKIEKEPTQYQKLLMKKEWIEKRKEILKLHNKTCDKCGNTKCLNVHHKYYKFGLNPWEYPNDAFLVLCKDCHDEIHNILK